MIGLLPTQALNSYIGSTLRTMNDVVNQDKSRGYAVIFIQVLISLCLMWYVIRRARYELNKVCLPPSKQLQPLKQALRHSKSTSLNGFNFSSTALDDYDVNADLEELHDRKENKPGHKRAKSASAILVDLELD